MNIGRRLIALALWISITGLSGCAQYQVQTNKAMGYSKIIDRLAVWSAVRQVPSLGIKNWTQNDSFENVFHASLKRELAAVGVISEVRPFIPATDTAESLARFETELAPTMRLLIAPAKYQTFTYNGSTGITRIVFDLSLFEIASSKRVWRAQLVIDNPLGGGFAWGEDGAKNLERQIMDALRKDKFLNASPLPKGTT